MSRSMVFSLLLLSLIAAPATAERTVQLALPTQEPDDFPRRPVGDPDIPPVSIDLFDSGTSHEEAWPWPILPTDN